MTEHNPASYGTPQDPRPTLAQVLAAYAAAVAYWDEEQAESAKIPQAA